MMKNRTGRNVLTVKRKLMRKGYADRVAFGMAQKIWDEYEADPSISVERRTELVEPNGKKNNGKIY